MPRGPPWERLCTISALIFTPILALIASLLPTIFGDSRDFETQDETRDEARDETQDKTRDKTGDEAQDETRASERT